MPRAVAINVAANTNEPGFRGPVYPDGTFVYVPIPESAPTRQDAVVPTYADLDLPFPLTPELRETPVHLDPSFPGVHGGTEATYGDPHGVKARPVASLNPGDWLFFYATLTLRPPSWEGVNDDRDGGWLRERGVDVDDGVPRDWGAFIIGGMRVDEAVDEPRRAAVADRFGSNAHLKRQSFDARVLVRGDPNASGLLDRAVPLSAPEAGVDANRLVTDLSADSGRGPWWRRPLRYDAEATGDLLAAIDRPPGYGST